MCIQCHSLNVRFWIIRHTSTSLLWGAQCNNCLLDWEEEE